MTAAPLRGAPAPHTPRLELAFTELNAASSWRSIALIADLHLGAQAPRTTRAFLAWLEGPARQADALFILGDLFEAWIGDDLLEAPARSLVPADAACAQDVAAALRAYAERGRDLLVQHGNRDFLLGERFARATGARLLPDPLVLTFQNQRLLLTHGDRLCIADTAYQQFRATVRNPQWQRQVLAQPLAVRAQQALALRAASQAAQSRPENWADADPHEARRWLAEADSTWMIHGHTHRPRNHWGGGLLRQVLSDWDFDATRGHRPRAQALWLLARGRVLEVDSRCCFQDTP